MNLRQFKTITERRKALEKKFNVSLGNIGSYTLDDFFASTRNCENMIGVAQVPMGVAGPLQVQSLKLKAQSYYLPLATTEGALVASVNRGCKAITLSGGATVDSYRVGATRGPVFRVDNLKESERLNQYLAKNFSKLKTIAAKTSSHLKLTKCMDRGVGKYRYLRFVFDTADAMGMNMVTIATDAIVTHLEQALGVTCLSVAGNFDVDKKPAFLNMIEGRGIKVWAEVTISQAILTEVLKTTAAEVYELWLAKCMLGSVVSGSLGYNAHVANVLAALFLATGQDLAHIGEGSTGITTTEIVKQKDKDSLYVSVCLPDLMVGTVGGGTGLATQQEALKLLGVAGGNEGNNALRFAEIVAAGVLAGEISLLASEAAGTLAAAHQKLGRGRAKLLKI